MLSFPLGSGVYWDLKESFSNYLINPQGIGVNLTRLIIDTTAIEQFGKKSLMGVLRKNETLTWAHSGIVPFLNYSLSDHLGTGRLDKEIEKILGDWLLDISQLADTGGNVKLIKISGKDLRIPYWPFGPNIAMPLFHDAIHIGETVEREPGKLSGKIIVDIVGLGKDGVNMYHHLLEQLPIIDKEMKIVFKNKKTHSARYVFEPILSISLIWLGEENTIAIVPKFFRDYIRTAVIYLSRNEWRTSIVLSAITVETLLAELFEEEFHEQAPNVPLGNLLNAINEKLKNTSRKNLLGNIKDDIEVANAARIAAVHRGVQQVTQKEALDALKGAVKTLCWFFFEYGQTKNKKTQ